MICPKCHSEIDDGAKFCTHCGYNLSQSEHDVDKGYSSILLFIWIAIRGVCELINGVIFLVNDSWYTTSVKYVVYSLWMLVNLSLFLIPLSIRNKVLKVIGFIIVSILVVYYIYNNIKSFSVTY